MIINMCMKIYEHVIVSLMVNKMHTKSRIMGDIVLSAKINT